jgi:hypothetical protein
MDYRVTYTDDKSTFYKYRSEKFVPEYNTWNIINIHLTKWGAEREIKKDYRKLQSEKARRHRKVINVITYD